MDHLHHCSFCEKYFSFIRLLMTTCFSILLMFRHLCSEHSGSECCAVYNVQLFTVKLMLPNFKIKIYTQQFDCAYRIRTSIETFFNYSIDIFHVLSMQCRKQTAQMNSLICICKFRINNPLKNINTIS